MDWPLAIDRNRNALRLIVAALMAMVNAAMRGKVLTLPRHVHSAVMLILRPAESAVRRLIVFAARGLPLKPLAARSLPDGLPAFPATGALKTPAFCLFDPLKHFMLEDFDTGALPRIGFFGTFDPAFFAAHQSPPEEPVNAARLYGRLRALRSALDDLSRQARRLARWQARRDLALAANRPMRITPFRPGLPPGWRQRRLHEVDDVLRECHGLARYAVNGPDTG